MSSFITRRALLRAIAAAGSGLAVAPVLGLSSAGAAGMKLAVGRGATAIPLEAVRLAQGFGGSGLPITVPREQVYVVDQIFRYSVANNFNMFVPGGPPMPTRQGLVMDMLWYIDQDSGEWINSLASDRPTYNADNTQMTIPLRQGVKWSDGVEFTADDVLHHPVADEHTGLAVLGGNEAVRQRCFRC